MVSHILVLSVPFRTILWCYHGSGMHIHTQTHRRHGDVLACCSAEQFWLWLGSRGFTAVGQPRLRIWNSLTFSFILYPSASPPAAEVVIIHTTPYTHTHTHTHTDFNEVGKERLNVRTRCKGGFVVLPWRYSLVTSLRKAQTFQKVINMGRNRERRRRQDSSHSLLLFLSVSLSLSLSFPVCDCVC